MNQIQHDIDDKLDEIQSMTWQQTAPFPMQWSNQITRGLRQNPRYNEEFQLVLLHDNNKREVTTMDEHNEVELIIEIVLTQYSMRASLKKIKKEGNDSLQRELKQLHDIVYL